MNIMKYHEIKWDLMMNGKNARSGKNRKFGDKSDLVIFLVMSGISK
jgi:hypothetical protein